MRRLILMFISLPLVLLAVEIRNPSQYLDVEIGADRTLIDWEEITKYYGYVAGLSDMVTVESLGTTTLGRQFIMAIISDAENMRRLPQIRANQERLALNDNLSDGEREQLIAGTPVILMVTFNIHATEIGSSQAAVELLYEIVTNGKPGLKNVVVLLVPSVNPDGQQMVTDWYRKYVNTSYEGAPLPELYHHYAGHDNNRDWHYFNLQETQLLAQVLYRDWFPEVVYDQHQMGSRGPRIFLPPYADPVNPVIPAQLTAQVNFIGEKIVSDLHDAGFQGIATGTIFNAYFQGTLSKTPLWHNRVGILCEVASTRIATPLFFPFGSFNSFGPDLPEYKTQTNFLDPWEGGWWRLRDIMDLEKSVFYSILEVTSTYHAKIKQQFFHLNLSNTNKGREEAPYGYFIPRQQRDRSVLREMLIKLSRGGVKIDTLTQPMQSERRYFGKGTFYISCAQPERNYIIDLFREHHYPELRQYPDGPPLEPYDVTTWNMPMQMGVEVFEDNTGTAVPGKAIDRIQAFHPKGTADGSGSYVIFKPGSNWGVSMAIKFLDEKKPVWQAVKPFTVDGMDFPAGSFIIGAEDEENRICTELTAKAIDTYRQSQMPEATVKTLTSGGIGLYSPLYPSMDEGWTRWVLDTYQIDHKKIDTNQLSNGGLKNINTLIIPSIRSEVLSQGLNAYDDKDHKIADVKIPPEYKMGLGKTAMAEIRQFVYGGGRLVLLHRSIPFFADSLGLPVSVLNSNLPREEFYIPGSLLHLDLDPKHYLSFGMPHRINVFYDSQGPVIKLLPYTREVFAAGIFPAHELLSSGWVLGEVWLHNRVGLVDIPVGEGNVILFGFRPQHRGQTHGTFGLLFNSLIR